jgi:hypothetical protein
MVQNYLDISMNKGENKERSGNHSVEPRGRAQPSVSNVKRALMNHEQTEVRAEYRGYALLPKHYYPGAFGLSVCVRYS